MRLRRRHASTQPRARGPRRVLILSADVGEGHAAAARALKEQLENGPEPVEVTIIDGLRGMGRTLRYVVEDGYRTQLRFIPWSYTLVYWMLEHIPPARWSAKFWLCLLGSRPLQRKIAEHDPDVIVSTYPAVTVVLARLRRLGSISCPTIATITDMTGLFFWAQRGIDTHLVMYDASVGDVEKIAGSDSVRVVRPLISAEFLEPRDRDAARDALGMPREGRLVIVSGGGWGVGDIAGAVKVLARVPDTTIICLAGKNEQAHAKLSARFADDPRVQVLGFTDQMSELLAAADVLVHSTGGVTCLEAMARGCPVVSYGLPVGHAKINTRAMAQLDLVRLANSSAELVDHVERSFAERDGTASAAIAPTIDASEIVLSPPQRVQPLPAWRPRLAQVSAAVMMALTTGTWMLSTDEFTALAQSVLRVHPVRTMHVSGQSVALIIRTPQATIERVARHLRHDGVHASFATTTAPAAGTLQTLQALGDAALPEIDHTKALRWLQTRGKLRREARALHLRHRYYYLAPRTLTVGQLVMARTAGARPVVGSVQIDRRSPVPQRPLRAGDVVVVTLDGSSASLRAFDRFAAELAAERLGTVPLSAS